MDMHVKHLYIGDTCTDPGYDIWELSFSNGECVQCMCYGSCSIKSAKECYNCLCESKDAAAALREHDEIMESMYDFCDYD